MKLRIIGQDYSWGPCSDIKTIPLGDEVTVPCDAFPDEAAAEQPIAEGFAEEVE